MSLKSYAQAKALSLPKSLLIGFMDVLSITISFFAGLWLRFEFSFSLIPPEYLNGYTSTIIWWCAISVVVFALFNLYNSIWVFVSRDGMFRIIGA